MKRPEILAPAGNEEAALAAINAGADAVYAGLPVFNARLMGENFSYESFEETRQLCQVHQVKFYVVLNTLIKDKEIDEARKALDFVSRLKVDGVIIQDPGLIEIARREYPDLALQVSTQLTVYGIEGVKFFEELGFTRAVLPREMSIEEAGKIRERTNMEIKLFGHGALCYAYSGQCSFSSSLGPRSGNRGRCAQPCRKTYILKNQKGQVLKEGFLLATRDLNTLDALPLMMEKGIDSIKIEGRLKSPEYVYAVTKAYKDELDRLEGKTHSENKSRETLKAVFQRGFTGGNLFGKDKRLTPDIGKKRGLHIGEVIGVQDGILKIRLKRGITLSNGDGIAFGKDEKTGMNVSQIYKKADLKDQVKKAEGTVFVRMKEGLEGLHKGMPVYRSLDHILMKALKGEARKEPEKAKIVLDLDISCYEMAPVFISVRSGDIEAEYTSDIFPEEAKSLALTEEAFVEQLRKTGNTDYEMDKIRIHLGEGLYLSKKQMNQIRNEAIAAIEQLLEKDMQGKKESDFIPVELPALAELPCFSYPSRLYSAELEKGYTLEELLEMGMDEYIFPIDVLSDMDDSVLQGLHQAGKTILASSPLIVTTKMTDAIHKNRKAFLHLLSKTDGFLIKNYEMLHLINGMKKELPENFVLEADDSMHVMNRFASRFFYNQGIRRNVMSTEMSLDEIRKLANDSFMDTSFIAYGRRKLMHSGYCVFDCENRDCTNCKNQNLYQLVSDDKTYGLKVQDGINIIYDADPIALSYETLENLPVHRLRFLVTDEDPLKIRAVRDYYENGNQRPAWLIENLKSYNKGVL